LTQLDAAPLPMPLPPRLSLRADWLRQDGVSVVVVGSLATGPPPPPPPNLNGIVRRNLAPAVFDSDFVRSFTDENYYLGS